MNVRFLILLIFSLSACKTQYQVKENAHQAIRLKGDSLNLNDQRVQELIQPYKLKLDSAMNNRIMVASADLKKGNPEGSLGNMVCDLLMNYAGAQKLKADFCILNNGGLRIPVLYKGDVTVRTVYELMPFDNQLVLLKVEGRECLKLFQLIANNNGVPVSGLRMVIEGDSAQEMEIGGEVFHPEKAYWILTSDYLANGGDKAEALKNPLERIDTHVLIRDVLIAQMKEMYYNGETLQALTDGRITKR